MTSKQHYTLFATSKEQRLIYRRLSQTYQPSKLPRAKDKMITYEITATVAEDLFDRYEKFMIERHIPDLLATGAFSGALFEMSVPGRYRIRYMANDRKALDRYLSEYSSQLRKHFQDTFPEGVQLSREEWQNIRSWNVK